MTGSTFIQNRAGNGHWFKSLALMTFMAFFVVAVCQSKLRFNASLAGHASVARDLAQLRRAVPQMDMAMTRELNDESSSIDASLVGAPNVRIQATSAALDQSFGNIGMGFVFVTANGKQLYLPYRRLCAAERLQRGMIKFGGRFEF